MTFKAGAVEPDAVRMFELSVALSLPVFVLVPVVLPLLPSLVLVLSPLAVFELMGRAPSFELVLSLLLEELGPEPALLLSPELPELEVGEEGEEESVVVVKVVGVAEVVGVADEVGEAGSSPPIRAVRRGLKIGIDTGRSRREGSRFSKELWAKIARDKRV